MFSTMKRRTKVAVITVCTALKLIQLLGKHGSAGGW